MKPSTGAIKWGCGALHYSVANLSLLGSWLNQYLVTKVTHYVGPTIFSDMQQIMKFYPNMDVPLFSLLRPSLRCNTRRFLPLFITRQRNNWVILKFFSLSNSFCMGTNLMRQSHDCGTPMAKGLTEQQHKDNIFKQQIFGSQSKRKKLVQLWGSFTVPFASTDVSGALVWKEALFCLPGSEEGKP